jgi:Ras-related protein Rab-8A
MFILDVQVIDTARGQALADEFGIKFFETSAKNNINVEKAFFEIARDVMKRLQEQEGSDGNKKKQDTVKVKQEPSSGTSKCSC